MKKALFITFVAIVTFAIAQPTFSQTVSEAFQDTPSTTFYTSVVVSTDFETTVENVKTE